MAITIQLRTIATFVAGVVVASVAAFVFRPWGVHATPGDSDATLVPITPCRLVDTRPLSRVGAASTFDAGSKQTIAGRGTHGRCTIPTDAIGLSLNVTATDATAPTFLTIWPGGERPDASSLNPAPGQPPTPNAVVTLLSVGGSFDVFNLAGRVEVIVDVNGYYTSTSLQQLNQRITQLEASKPFTVASVINSQPYCCSMPIAFDTPTSIRQVTLTARVAGQVTVVASGSIFTPADLEIVQCGLYVPNEDPMVGPTFDRWQSPTGGDLEMFSLHRVFDIGAGQTQTYALKCWNQRSGGSSGIFTPRIAATFTPAA